MCRPAWVYTTPWNKRVESYFYSRWLRFINQLVDFKHRFLWLNQTLETNTYLTEILLTDFLYINHQRVKIVDDELFNRRAFNNLQELKAIKQSTIKYFENK